MAFTSIPNEAIDRMTELSAGAWRLYCVLARYRNQKTGKCCPSAQTLAQVMKMDRRHIFRLKGELAQLEWARFDGGNVTELLGFGGDIIVTTPGDNNSTVKKVTSAKNVTPQGQKCHQVVAKMSVAYKEEQDERTRLIEQDNTPVAVAPAGGLSSKECYTLFVELRTATGGYEVPYQNGAKDFVQLAKLLKTCERTNWTLTAERFRQAARNYFVTPRSSHTLADLAAHFSDFFKHALDRFGKPVEENGNGRHQVPRNETYGERTGRQMEELFANSLAASIGDSGPDTADTEAPWPAIDSGGF